MLLSRNKTALIIIHRNSLDFFSAQTPNILKFTFPPNIVKDIEIVNSEELSLQIKSFIKSNKIPLYNLVIVLCESVYFQKDLPLDLPYQNKEHEKQIFLDNVPFEYISSKIFKTKNGERIIAINRELHRSIKNTFEQLGFVVTGIVPISVLELPASEGDNISVETAKLLLSRSDSLSHYSFSVNHKSLRKQKKKRAKKNKNLVILVIIFFFLIIILVFVLIKTFSSQSSAPEANKSSDNLPAESMEPTSTPIRETVNKTNELNKTLKQNYRKDNLTAKVFTSPKETNNAQLFIEKLGEFEYINDIEIENTGNISTHATMIIFAQNISPSIRTQITNLASNYYSNISIQETNDSRYDITIIIKT